MCNQKSVHFPLQPNRIKLNKWIHYDLSLFKIILGIEILWWFPSRIRLSTSGCIHKPIWDSRFFPTSSSTDKPYAGSDTLVSYLSDSRVRYNDIMNFSDRIVLERLFWLSVESVGLAYKELNLVDCTIENPC